MTKECPKKHDGSEIYINKVAFLERIHKTHCNMPIDITYNIKLAKQGLSKITRKSIIRMLN